jgi:hypothetical protein
MHALRDTARLLYYIYRRRPRLSIGIHTFQLGTFEINYTGYCVQMKISVYFAILGPTLALCRASLRFSHTLRIVKSAESNVNIHPILNTNVRFHT